LLHGRGQKAGVPHGLHRGQLGQAEGLADLRDLLLQHGRLDAAQAHLGGFGIRQVGARDGPARALLVVAQHGITDCP